MQAIEIFGFSGSTYVRTARMVCEEKHVAYRLQPLEFRQDSHRALHPFLRMPVIRIGDVLLYETLAIAIYVDAAFSGPRLSPDDALAQARMLQWISTCNDYLYRDLVQAFAKPDDPSEHDVAVARRDLEIVERQLQCGPYLAGASVSLSDLFLAPMIAFAGNTQAGTTLLRGLDGLGAWCDRLWSRASFVATRS
jgi:glutathione S-transferase